MKIAIGLSGGVDSSVAALLLKQQKQEVIGVTMRLWKSGRYAGGSRKACFGPDEEADISRAESFCRSIGIGYRVFDCSEAYESIVLSYFRSAYLAGRTPNPCIRCNAFMKFGLLPNLARQAGLQFDQFATGHYVRVWGEKGLYHLGRGFDKTKDQSYFLYRLSQSQLSSLRFPLGELLKTEVRALAAAWGLEAKDLPDSQDFYSGDYAELVGRPDCEGNIVDAAGRILGTHHGFWHYTIGQRKGLGLAASHPLYVRGLNACRNEVVVGPAEKLIAHRLTLTDCHWIAAAPIGEAQVKIRSTAEPCPCCIEGADVVIPGGVRAAAEGQSAVLYRGEETLGGGIIMKAFYE